MFPCREASFTPARYLELARARVTCFVLAPNWENCHTLLLTLVRGGPSSGQKVAAHVKDLAMDHAGGGGRGPRSGSTGDPGGVR
jgi:hypothetical protein